LKDLKDDFL